GPEEVMRRTPRYTEINVIDNYAPTARLNVQVVDANGQKVPGATVEYKLYNYAEFYTVATKQADGYGRSFLTAGLGDMLIWATKGGRFGFVWQGQLGDRGSQLRRRQPAPDRNRHRHRATGRACQHSARHSRTARAQHQAVCL
ncbi:MAG: hypothetical protein ACOCOT_07955, partial [Prevotella sp.]